MAARTESVVCAQSGVEGGGGGLAARLTFRDKVTLNCGPLSKFLRVSLRKRGRQVLSGTGSAQVAARARRGHARRTGRASRA